MCSCKSENCLLLLLLLMHSVWILLLINVWKIFYLPSLWWMLKRKVLNKWSMPSCGNIVPPTPLYCFVDIKYELKTLTITWIDCQKVAFTFRNRSTVYLSLTPFWVLRQVDCLHDINLILGIMSQTPFRPYMACLSLSWSTRNLN